MNVETFMALAMLLIANLCVLYCAFKMIQPLIIKKQERSMPLDENKVKYHTLYNMDLEVYSCGLVSHTAPARPENYIISARPREVWSDVNGQRSFTAGEETLQLTMSVTEKEFISIATAAKSFKRMRWLLSHPTDGKVYYSGLPRIVDIEYSLGGIPMAVTVDFHDFEVTKA